MDRINGLAFVLLTVSAAAEVGLKKINKVVLEDKSAHVTWKSELENKSIWSKEYL
jgi:hypothetical protein